MKVINELRQIFKIANVHGINYCILRNFEFLLGREDYEQDLDIGTTRNNQEVLETILIQRNYVKKSGSVQETKYSKYISEERRFVNIHIHFDCLRYHTLPYLDIARMLKRKKRTNSFFVPSSEDLAIELAFHAIFRKKFKPKYQLELKKLFKKSLDWSYISANLSAKIVANLRQQSFARLIKQRKMLILQLIKKHPLKTATFVVSKVKSYTNILKSKFKKPKVIAFVGIDGSGKSTVISALTNVLDRNKWKYGVVYMGHWKNKSKITMQAAQLAKTAKKNITLKEIFWVVDLYIRYLKKIRFAKKNLILTDRYAYDLVAFDKVGVFARLLLKLFPDPTITYFLYNTPKELFKRGKINSIEEAKIKMSAMTACLSNKNVKYIKTDNLEKNVQQLAKDLLL